MNFLDIMCCFISAVAVSLSPSARKLRKRRDQGMVIFLIEAWVARERITAPTPPPDYRGRGMLTLASPVTREHRFVNHCEGSLIAGI